MDLKIRPFYEAGAGCRVIGNALDENPVTILKRVRRMGIVRSLDEAHTKTRTDEITFRKAPSNKNLRKSAIGFVSHWFLERGYMVSIPLETTSYDLIVESDNGLQRVQVKTTTRKSNSNRWAVHCSRSVYDSKARQNAGGRRRRVAYTKNDADIIAAVTAAFDLYLIPVTYNMPIQLTLDQKYRQFKVGGRRGSRTPIPK